MVGPAKDETLKNILSDDARAQQIKMKRELDQMDKERRSARGKNYWDDVAKNAEALLKKGNEGYQDWVAGMNSITNTMMDLALALDTDPLGNSNYAAIGGVKFTIEFLDVLVLTPVYGLIQGANEGLSFATGGRIPVVLPSREKLGQFAEGISQGVSGLGAGIPDVRFGVDVNEGRLTSKATKNGVDFGATEQGHFDTGVLAWATQQGYTRNADGLLVSNVDGSFLDRPTFQTLSMDPDSGLQPFLEGHFNFGLAYETPRVS